MKTLNLDKDFAPFEDGIDFKSFLFPSGCEMNICLDQMTGNDEFHKMRITTRIKSSDDIMTLLLATDAVRRMRVKDIELFIPYLPYARQDRVMKGGEALSLKVFSDLINSQGYSRVGVYDVHSEVALALINNVYHINNHALVSQVLNDDTDYFVVSPDAGAYKKIFKVCQHVGYRGDIVLCNKFRDVTNGVIHSVTLSHDDLGGRNTYIIDDICDGGGTFVLLAEELKKRNAGKIYLIASHGIFSKGIDALRGIDHVFTTDSFKDHDPHQKLTQIKLESLL